MTLAMRLSSKAIPCVFFLSLLIFGTPYMQLHGREGLYDNGKQRRQAKAIELFAGADRSHLLFVQCTQQIIASTESLTLSAATFSCHILRRYANFPRQIEAIAKMLRAFRYQAVTAAGALPLVAALIRPVRHLSRADHLTSKRGLDELLPIRYEELLTDKYLRFVF
jgi:hypothetical protein